MKAFVIPLVFYYMAVIGLCVEFLPEPALAIFGGKPEGETRPITLGFVFAFGAVGVLLHWVLYRRNPERFDSPLMIKVGSCMAIVLAGLFGASAMLSVSTGAPPEQLTRSTNDFVSKAGLLIIGGLSLLLVGIVVAMFVLLHFHPLNRMSRKLQAEEYRAAIAIGERALRRSDNAAVRFNLALAYAADGRAEPARAIYDDLAAMERPPEPFSEATYSTALEQLRTTLERSSGKRPSR